MELIENFQEYAVQQLLWNLDEIKERLYEIPKLRDKDEIDGFLIQDVMETWIGIVDSQSINWCEKYRPNSWLEEHPETLISYFVNGIKRNLYPVILKKTIIPRLTKAGAKISPMLQYYEFNQDNKTLHVRVAPNCERVVVEFTKPIEFSGADEVQE